MWFGVSVLAAVIALFVIRRFFGARRTMRRMALSLAVCERALEDALGELSLAPAREGGCDMFVSPFEPVVQRLLSIPDAELIQLGKPAALLGRRLGACVAAWNAAAGRTERREALLPLVLEAHHLARELVAYLEEDSLRGARSAVQSRVLVALVAPRDPPSAWLH